MNLRSQPYWWTANDKPQQVANVPHIEPSYDVVIVGAGLTGLSAALVLSRAGKSILILEQQEVGLGASGRNGGMLGGGHRLSFAQLKVVYGSDIALALLKEAQIDSTFFAKELIRDENLRCDFQACGRFRGFWTAQDYESGQQELDLLREKIDLEAWMVPKASMDQELASPLYEGGVVYPHHAGLNPYTYVQHLCAKAVAVGASLLEHGRLVSVSTIGDTSSKGYELTVLRFNEVGSRQKVRVKAGQVLLATNAFTPDDQPFFRSRLFRVPSFISVTEPLGRAFVQSLLPSGRMYVETRVRHCYFRPTPDGQRIMLGGRAALIDVPEKFVLKQHAKLLKQIFPDLETPRFSHSWRGYTAFNHDYLPSIGQVPAGAKSRGAEGMWYALAYCGNGNSMAPYLGYKVAHAMLANPESETAFAHVRLRPKFWTRPKVGQTPWFMSFADLGFRYRDWREGRKLK